MRTFILLICTVLTLAFFGAGVFPGILQPVAVVLCLGCVLTWRAAAGKTGWLSLLAVALVGYVLVTVVPFPDGLNSAMGRKVAGQNELARKAIDEAAKLGIADAPGPHFALSRNRAGTMRILLLLIAGFAAAALGSRLTPQWSEKYVASLVVVGILIAVAGYYSQRIWPQEKSIWWLFPVEHGRPVGCFINRNHFGGFMAMLCPAAAVLFVERLSGGKRVETVFWAIGFGAMSLAAVMSLSRGAWLAYAAACIAVVVLLMLCRRIKAGVFLLGLVVCALMIVVLPARDELAGRFGEAADLSQEDSSLRFRLTTWRDSLRVFPDYPVVGTGANGLRMVLPQYRATTTRRQAAHSENEYVQLAVEFGVIGFGLIAGICVCVAWTWWKNIAVGAVGRSVGLSVGGAVVAVLTHSAVDFALRVPLYFIVLCSLVGLVIASPAGTSPAPVTGNAGGPDQASQRRPGLRRIMGRVTVPVCGILIVLVISVFGRTPYDLDSTDSLDRADAGRLCQALEWSPTSWQAWFCLGHAAIAAPSGDGAAFGERCIARATEYDPQNYLAWRSLAEVRLRMNDGQGARAAYRRAKSLRSWIMMPSLE